MILMYTGTPGSGKSLDVARDIYRKIINGQNVICCNMKVHYDYICKHPQKEKINSFSRKFFKKDIFSSTNRLNVGSLESITLDELTPEYLYEYAFQNHVKGVEDQTTLFIDEAQNKFSPGAIKFARALNPRFLLDWQEFFTVHRHLGYRICFITQYDKLLDLTIRSVCEYNVVHRKLNNIMRALFDNNLVVTIVTIPIQILFFLYFFVTKKQAFIRIVYYYGVKLKMESEMFFFDKKYQSVYDSYNYFDILSSRYNKKEEYEDCSDLA